MKPLDTWVKLDISGELEMRLCSHPGPSAYGNTSLSITVTDGAWVPVGPQDNMHGYDPPYSHRSDEEAAGGEGL